DFEPFLRHASENHACSGARLDKARLGQHGSPIKNVMTPTQEVVDWVNGVVYSAHQSGFYVNKRRIPGLSPGDYEHPLDRKYLDALRGTPGLDTLVRKFFDWGLEPLVKVQYTGSNIKVSEKSLPQVYKALVTACEVLSVATVPDLYVELGFVNGLTIGARSPVIVLTSGCFGALSYEELLFVIGHEIGHIKSEHCLYHTMGAVVPILGDILGSVTLGLGGLVSAGLQVALCNWQRMSEFTADRAGLLCCQNLDAAVTAMMKLAGAPPRFYNQLDPKHFLEQAREFQGLDTGSGKIVKALSVMYMNHPWAVMRAKEMDSWVQNGDFGRAIARSVVSESRPLSLPSADQPVVLGPAVNNGNGAFVRDASGWHPLHPAQPVDPQETTFARSSPNCLIASGDYGKIVEAAANAVRACGFTVGACDTGKGELVASRSGHGRTGAQTVRVLFRAVGDGRIQITYSASAEAGTVAGTVHHHDFDRFCTALVSQNGSA
ncbi:MAG: M48 family metallopeptidase, partial [Phycisphaerae bacterium]